MAYLGPKPSQTLATPTSQYFNGTGSQTVFTLNRAVNVSEDLEVFVNNIQQEPGVGKSYTASGTTLTFDAAPSSGTANVYVVYRGLAEVTTRLEHDPNAALAATTGTFSGDLTVDTNTLYVDSTNNRVGVGTTNTSVFNPFAADVIIGGGTTNAGITVYSGSASTGNINFADGTTGYDLYQGYINYDHSNNKMEFYVNYAGSGSPRMSIDSSGNVGIGNVSPSSYYSNSNQLVVGSGAARQGITIASSTTTIGQLAFADGTSGDARYEGWVIYDHNTDHMSFGTSASERLRIDSSGKVGIGTSNITSPFVVNTSFNSGYLSQFVNTGTGSDPNGVLIQAGVVDSAYVLRLQKQNASDVLVVRGSGNVGIGITSPSELLHIRNASGDAAVRVQGNTRTFNIQQNNYGLRFVDIDAGSAERMRIDAAGNVTMPNQPSFAATRSQGNVNNGVYVFPNIYHNTGNHYNSSNGRFTAPVTGSYFISTNVMNENNNTYNNYTYEIRVNGSLFQYVYSSSGSNVHHRWNWSGVMYLQAGDYVEIYVPSNFYLYGNANQYTHFSGHLLG